MKSTGPVFQKKQKFNFSKKKKFGSKIWLEFLKSVLIILTFWFQNLNFHSLVYTSWKYVMGWFCVLWFLGCVFQWQIILTDFFTFFDVKTVPTIRILWFLINLKGLDVLFNNRQGLYGSVFSKSVEKSGNTKKNPNLF